VERTRLILHLVDAAAIDPENPLAAFDTVNNEMALYSPTLARKPQVVALNKLDLPGSDEHARAFRAALKTRRKIHLLSAATGAGVAPLLTDICRRLDRVAHEPEPDPD
jgi:GTP-binding protein